MAAGLNKSRIRDSKILFIVVFLLVILSGDVIAERSKLVHGIATYLGYFLVVICAIGRVYTTAFVGGFKNKLVVNYGPFSICRNPLYMFSIIGVTGVSLMSGHLFVMIFAPIVFYTIYYKLILREEIYLKEKFGQPYEEYMAKTPRLIPNLKLYNAPAVVDMAPKNVLRACFDAMAWFLALPLIELIGYVKQVTGYEPLFYLL